MTDGSENELRDALLRMSVAVRPMGSAAETIHAGVRRSRRRRALSTIVGTAGLVAAVAAGSYSLAGPGTGPRQVQPDPATSSPSGHGDLFRCSTESRVVNDPPTITDLEQQQAIVRQLLALSSVQVRHAAPSPLGVVALVVDDSGDPDSHADPVVVAQLQEAGAAHVFEWDPSMASVAVDADGQVLRVLQWLLQPAIDDVRRATRGLPGNAGLALWQDAGAVLLQWKTPVPREVLALAGVRPDGVEVLVEPVSYSRQDIRRAMGRLPNVLRERGLWGRSSSSYSCADGSGLVVGIAPPPTDRAELEADLTELQADLTEALGLPVTVISEDRFRRLPMGRSPTPERPLATPTR